MLVGVLLGAIFVTPLVVTYLLFIRWVDRFEPEPWWMIFLAFVWGAAFATRGTLLIAGMAHAFTAEVLPSADAVEAIDATVYAPIFEEGFKACGVGLIALVSMFRTKHLDGPLDGAIYGGVIGLGFTLTEDIMYVSHAYAKEGIAGFTFVLFLRTVFLGLSHCTFTACTGLGFGIASQAKSGIGKLIAVVIGLGCAVGMHAVHNFLPTAFGGAGAVVMIIESWAINLFFFVLLALLVVRDRTIVVRELFGEVGHLVDPRELKLVSSYFALSFTNWDVLVTKGWTAFRVRRQKQLKLIELAFLKSRRRRGAAGADLDRREALLRQEIRTASERGVWLGS